jgi:hypothetical protein
MGFFMSQILRRQIKKEGKMNPEGQEVTEALQHGAGSAFTAQHLNAC